MKQYKVEEYIIGDRSDALNVCSILVDTASKYGVVTVGDYHDLIGVTSNYAHHCFGWTPDLLSNIKVIIYPKGGYSIDLPMANELQPLPDVEPCALKVAPTQSYHFISYMYGASVRELTHTVTSEHPFDWQARVNKAYPGQYVLVSWKEISRDEYDKYLEIVEPI